MKANNGLYFEQKIEAEYIESVDIHNNNTIALGASK